MKQVDTFVMALLECCNEEMCFIVLELSVRWYTVVYILGVYIECLPRVS
jgi:prolipoprotein diacylglyceryltransferase